MYSSWWQFQLPTANPGGSWFALFASHWPIRDTGTSRPCLSVTGAAYECPVVSSVLFMTWVSACFWGIKSKTTCFFTHFFTYEMSTLEDERLEPTNHPFRKENDLNQSSMIMFHVNLQEGWSNFEPNLHLERETIQFDLRIFFNWVGSTTNQLSIQFYLAPPSTKKQVPLLATTIFKVWNHYINHH